MPLIRTSQMATDEEFENITYRINEQKHVNTHSRKKVTYVRFVWKQITMVRAKYLETHILSVSALPNC